MNKNKNNLKAYLTLHAYGNLIIHGWNYAARTYPDNVEELRVVAEKMAKAIVQEGGAPFKIGSAPDILCLFLLENILSVYLYRYLELFSIYFLRAVNCVHRWNHKFIVFNKLNN
ncbi:unnamed protein product [Meloidogyne enterolobii]|uniref:Uncharacterized protein n=1 Tax=Meloidogyne enterolobii TaxID=390850 RepID=A0ACB0YHX6_MELEN